MDKIKKEITKLLSDKNKFSDNDIEETLIRFTSCSDIREFTQTYISKIDNTTDLYYFKELLLKKLNSK